MRIGELARLSGLSKDGIRHYEALGIIRATRRRAGSRWYGEYDGTALDAIDKARQAQQLGLSLKEIAPLLKAHDIRPMGRPETIAFLEERLRVVREKIAGLREAERFIVHKIGLYKRAPGED